jgi:hypothetical protein
MEVVPNQRATWIIDPPYQDQGKHYTCGSKYIDYNKLREWCDTRLGQVIVCESEGADWYDFRPFRKIWGVRRKSQEVFHHHFRFFENELTAIPA